MEGGRGGRRGGREKSPSENSVLTPQSFASTKSFPWDHFSRTTRGKGKKGGGRRKKKKGKKGCDITIPTVNYFRFLDTEGRKEKKETLNIDLIMTTHYLF